MFRWLIKRIQPDKILSISALTYDQFFYDRIAVLFVFQKAMSLALLTFGVD